MNSYPVRVRGSESEKSEFRTRNSELGTFGDGWLDMIGRLKPGHTIEEARAELTTLARRFEAAYPSSNKNLSVHLSPVQGVYARAREAAGNQSTLLMLSLRSRSARSADLDSRLVVACGNRACGLLPPREASRKGGPDDRAAL